MLTKCCQWLWDLRSYKNGIYFVHFADKILTYKGKDKTSADIQYIVRNKAISFNICDTINWITSLIGKNAYVIVVNSLLSQILYSAIAHDAWTTPLCACEQTFMWAREYLPNNFYVLVKLLGCLRRKKTTFLLLI